MAKYSVWDQDGKWLYDVEGNSVEDVLREIHNKSGIDSAGYSVKLVSEQESEITSKP